MNHCATRSGESHVLTEMLTALHLQRGACVAVAQHDTFVN